MCGERRMEYSDLVGKSEGKNLDDGRIILKHILKK
jgi:hypothetical protein